MQCNVTFTFCTGSFHFIRNVSVWSE